MRGAVIEGNISLTLKNNQITLLSERDNKTLDEISLEDDYYRNDVYSLAKNLMGQCMKMLCDLKGEMDMTDAVEEELKTNFNEDWEVSNC